MPTVLQKNLANEIIKNAKAKKKKNLGQLVESGGYSKTVAEAKPSEIIQQKGVLEALEEQGFTEDNAKRVVKQILNSDSTEPNARLKAADMVFKVHGSYAPDKNITMNITMKSIDPTDVTILENLKAIQEKLENE